MTDKPDTFVGLDMSGSQTRCLVAASDGPTLRYLSCGSMPPIRWDFGDARDRQMTDEAVVEAVGEAEASAGLTVHSAVVGLGGADVRSHLVKTTVAVPPERQAIGVEDVANAVNKASRGMLGDNPAVLQLAPLEFVADAGPAVQDPIGLPARRLGAYVRVIATGAEEHDQVQRTVKRASIRVEETILDGFASAYATLTSGETAKGVAHLHFGKAASSLTAFEEGRLRLACGLPLGRDDVVRSVAHSFSTDNAVASSLIDDFGTVGPGGVATGAHVVVPGPDPSRRGANSRAWPRDMLDKVIGQRVELCLQLARSELHREGLCHGALRSLVVSGDLAALPGIKDLAQTVVALRSRVGVPWLPEGLPDALCHPGWASAAGLVLYAHRLADTSAWEPEEGVEYEEPAEHVPVSQQERAA